MFTFALGLFAGHQFFSLYFQPLSAFRRGRKKEFGRKRPEGKTLITTTTCVRRAPCRVSTLSFLRSTVFIFSDRKCISRSWRKLMNYKPDNRIPSLFTDFDNIKDFPDFLKIHWLFPDLEKIFVFPWLFPGLENFSSFSDFSLTVATPSTVNSLYSIHLWDQYLVSVCQLRWGRLGERDLPHTKRQHTWKGEDPSTSKMLDGGSS